MNLPKLAMSLQPIKKEYEGKKQKALAPNLPRLSNGKCNKANKTRQEL